MKLRQAKKIVRNLANDRGQGFRRGKAIYRDAQIVKACLVIERALRRGVPVL